MKAPKVNIKEILGKLSFLTNNMALLVAVLIALVALIGLIPTRILGGRLREAIEKDSVGTSQDIARLSRTLKDSAESENEIKEGYINALKQDANEIELLVNQAVMRDLLRYDMFIADANEDYEVSRTLFKWFGQAYIAGIDEMMTNVEAGECAPMESIEEALKSASRQTRGVGVGGMPGYDMGGGMDMAYGAGGGGSAYGAAGGTGPRLSRLSELDRQIVDQVCLDAARAVKVYAKAPDIGGYPFWNTWVFEDQETAFRDCWYWQLGYWAIEDVIATIRTMNERADNVLEGPVKRLSSLTFTLRQSRRRRGGSRRGRQRFGGDKKTSGNNPVYVTNAQNVLALPCTGRVTNEEIDVFQFNVRVIVDEDQVMAFMDELCSAKEHTFKGFYGELDQEVTYQHNQISVLEGSIAAIEKSTAEHELYRYGDDRVVELDLICEYVLPRIPDYEALKPAPVRTDQQEAME